MGGEGMTMTKRFHRLRVHDARTGGKGAFLNPKGGNLL